MQVLAGADARVALPPDDRSLFHSLALLDEGLGQMSVERVRAFQVVETLASLVHEQGNAGIMVTHDLRMVQYADRVIQMLDGHLERIVSPDEDLSC